MNKDTIKGVEHQVLCEVNAKAQTPGWLQRVYDAGPQVATWVSVATLIGLSIVGLVTK